MALTGPGVVVLRAEQTILVVQPRYLETTSIQGVKEASFTACSCPAPVQLKQQRRLNLER